MQEQEERKLWSRRQTIHHTYGSDDDNEDERPTDEDNSESHKGGTSSTASNKSSTAPSMSSKAHHRLKCKCGSMDHKYTSHSSCPLNKKKKEAHTSDDTDNSTTITVHQDSSEDEIERSCTCGSQKTAHRHFCSINPRNYK